MFLILLNSCQQNKKEAKPKASFVAFGDSITEGATPTYGYINYLSSAANIIVDNRARGGTKTPEQKEIIYSTDVSSYDGIIFLSGFNDMRFYGTSEEGLENYKKELKEILDYFLTFNKKVYLGTCMRMLPDGYKQRDPFNKGSDLAASMYATSLTEVAKNFPNVVVVDTFSINFVAADISGDKVHPEISGMLKIAEQFYYKIAR